MESALGTRTVVTEQNVPTNFTIIPKNEFKILNVFKNIFKFARSECDSVE